MRLRRYGAATRNELGPQGRVTACPAGERRIMETKPPIARAILVGVQVAGVDDVAHAASIEELGLLVKTLGYEVVGTISQKRDEIDGATVLGKGRLEELAAMTGGTGVVGSMAIQRKSKARERFEDADGKKQATNIGEVVLLGTRGAELVIASSVLSIRQQEFRNLVRHRVCRGPTASTRPMQGKAGRSVVSILNVRFAPEADVP